MKSQWLFDIFPFIPGESVTLCKIQPIEDNSVLFILNDANNKKYIPVNPVPYDKFSVLGFFRQVDFNFSSKSSITFGIYSNDNLNVLVGIITIFNINQQLNSCDVRYTVATPYQCKGYATAALKEVLKFLFERVEVNRVHCSGLSKNIANEKVLMKCNFLKEGIERQGVYWEGMGIISLSHYSILREEYFAPKVNPEESSDEIQVEDI